MKSAVMLPVVLILFASSAAPVAARNFAHTFNCDVPEGNQSRWSREAEGPKLSISGSVEFVVLRRDPNWAAGVNIEIANGARHDTLAIQISATPKRDRLEVNVVRFKPDKDPETTKVGSIPAKGKIPFSLAYDRGEVSIAAGDLVSRAKIDFQPDELALACSTGEFNFDKVLIGD